ncbi:FMN-dependent NADH-azoreductase [Leucothrix sargassi]|nr:FMN-dependent NADH-azoreductase [Leucothrix sargassi]
MTTVLRIDASMRTEGSVSRILTDAVIQALGTDKVITHDLLASPAPLINEEWITANYTPEDQRNDAQKESLALSDQLITDMQAADTFVIGVPIYNFTVPAALKAWVDQICRAGVTFRYTENGPQGLLENKRAILVIASGGVPVDSPMDFATPYMRQVLAFIGITDVEIIAADSLMSDPNRLDQAKEKIAQLQAA